VLRRRRQLRHLHLHLHQRRHHQRRLAREWNPLQQVSLQLRQLAKRPLWLHLPQQQTQEEVVEWSLRQTWLGVLDECGVEWVGEVKGGIDV